MLIRLIAFAALAAAAPLHAQGPPRAIHVTGIGRVQAAPDMATLSFSIQGRSDGPKDAKEHADNVSAALVEALEKLGVASRDIRSTPVTLNPFVDPQTQRQLIRYDRTTRATLRDLSRCEDVERAALQAGVNSIGAVRFGVSDSAAMRSRARDRALDDARAQAEGIAHKLGLRLGPVQSVSVSEPQQIAPQPYETALARAQPNYRPGLIDITVSADLYYAIASR